MENEDVSGGPKLFRTTGLISYTDEYEGLKLTITVQPHGARGIINALLTDGKTRVKS